MKAEQEQKRKEAYLAYAVDGLTKTEVVTKYGINHGRLNTMIRASGHTSTPWKLDKRGRKPYLTENEFDDVMRVLDIYAVWKKTVTPATLKFLMQQRLAMRLDEQWENVTPPSMDNVRRKLKIFNAGKKKKHSSKCSSDRRGASEKDACC